MSICDVWTSSDFAIVAVDTKGSKGHAFSKMLPITNAGVILAFRGQRAVFMNTFFRLAGGLASQNELKNFDAIVEVLAKTTRTAGRDVALMPEARFGMEDITAQVVAVGWSDRLERMAAAEAVYLPGKEIEFTPPEDFGGIVTPCDPEELQAAWELPFRGQPGDFPAALMGLARRQVDYGRKHWPQHGFGGDLMVATLVRRATGTEISIQPLGSLP